MLIAVLQLSFFYTIAFAQQPIYRIDKIVLDENFTDINNWIVEKNKADSEQVFIAHNKLIIDTYGGATVWFRQALKGNILIRFKRKVVMDSCSNCRLSDLNQFFMATEANSSLTFNRKGGFTEYDSLNMYYVGMGGNYNSTTRFRKYNNGDKK